MSIAGSNLYSFDPDYVGTKIAAGDWAGCWDYLTEVIENLSITASANSLQLSIQIQKDMKDEGAKKYVKEFGTLLGELLLFLLTEKSTSLSDKNFQRLIVLHETIHTLFYIFSIDNTDMAVKAMLGDGKKKLSTTDQKKILILLSLDTELEIGTILKAVESHYRTAAVVSYFSHRKIFRERIYNNKAKLYDWRKEFGKTAQNIKDAHEVFLNNVTAYFLSSYMNVPNKHSVKENINFACQQYLASQHRDFKRICDNTPNPFKFNINPDLLTILIMTEVFSKNHAMYRGWGKLVKSLLGHFNVVFTMPSDRADNDLRKEYENFETFDSLGDLYFIAHCVKPDIIFMPSVGMRLYNVLMSNIRMAPIQIMGLGHPATSMSEFIDYVVSPKGLYDPAAFPKDIYIGDGYPEKHAPIVSKEEFFSPLPEAERIVQEPGQSRVVQVAIVGTDIKVSYPFFRLLKEIITDSPFPVHIHFMMGVGGIDSLYIEKYLQDNFPNVTYQGWQEYSDYLKTIKKIDIVLNPFPFGHTNTIIDTLMCGKPCVGLDGVEPSSKTEGDVLNAVGLKDAFIVQDEAAYKAKFYELGQRILNGETVFYDREKIYDRIFADLGEYDYGKVIKWVYDNDKRLKASGKKYFDVFEDI